MKTSPQTTCVVALCLLVSASSMAGCELWRNYDAVEPFDSTASDTSRTGDVRADGRRPDSRATPDAEARDVRPEAGVDASPCGSATGTPESIPLGNSGATRELVLCRGDTRAFALSPAVGTRLDVDLGYEIERATLSAGLYAEPPGATTGRPLTEPIWSDVGVGFSHRVTSPDSYYLVLRFPVDAPGSADRIDARLEISVETFADRVRWIAPDAPEGGDGTVGRPWREWETALTSLEPGDLLIAKSGTWTRGADCSEHAQPCLPEATLPDVDCELSEYSDASVDAPIILTAQWERASNLVAVGNDPAVFIDDCSHWHLDGLRLQNRDETSNDGGQVAQIDDSTDIRLERLLVQRPNRNQNVAALSITDSSDIDIVETGIYSFHEEAIRLSDVQGGTILRSYIHSRNLDDTKVDADFSDDDDRGDIGIFLKRASGMHVVDTVVEDVGVGIQIDANGSSGSSNVSVSDDNSFRGVMVRQTDEGFVFDSDAGPCETPDTGACVVEQNRIRDSVVLDTGAGFRVDGGREISIEHASCFDAERRFFSLEPGDPDSQDQFPPSESLSITESLAVGSGDVGFRVDGDVDDFSVAQVNAFGPSTPYDAPQSLQNTHEVDPELDGCLVYIPSSSPMRSLEDEPIGAHIVRRHDGQSTTNRRLWHQLDGRFPCGATVEDFNDTPDASCIGLHERFHVGVETCPIP